MDRRRVESETASYELCEASAPWVIVITAPVRGLKVGGLKPTHRAHKRSRCKKIRPGVHPPAADGTAIERRNSNEERIRRVSPQGRKTWVRRWCHNRKRSASCY